MLDPDDPTGSGSRLFVDRLPEAEILRQSLLQHRTRMDDGLITPTQLRNVLSFYGEGGTGKTELSRQLAAWVTGDDAVQAGWGDPPETKVDVCARWDVNDSRGVVDPLPLLIAIRTQLGAVKASWPAFDMAFEALFRALRPGRELRLRLPNSGGTTLSDVVAGLLGDTVTAAGIAASGGVAAGVFGVGRSVLSAARDHVRGRAVLRAYGQLEELLASCEAASGELEQAARLAGRVAFFLTEEIDRMRPGDRPTVVVFVDHIERLQIPGERHLGEAVLNRLVARFPYFLFVITGRNSLRWHEPTPDLPANGPDVWPLLSTERPSSEPGQHLIGYLSTPDTIRFLEESFEREGIVVQQGLVEHLAEATNGWPLHLQTIVGVARERITSGVPLSAVDLDGPLPSLVERLLSDLPADVADAFRAACLLPFFDTDLVAAAGEVHAGAVERLIKRQLVRANPGSNYPYRVHDTLRTLIRTTGSDAAGAWGAADWERHSNLAMTESKRRFDEAMADQNDSAALLSLALALNLATENGLFDPWLIGAIRRSPSIHRLAPLISAEASRHSSSDLQDTLEFLQLRARARLDDTTDSLKELVDRQSAISSSAGTWRVYDLRKRGRVDDAIEQLEELLDRFGDRPELYRNQIVTTLRLARRYREAVDRFSTLTDTQQKTQLAAIDRRHGKFEGSSAAFSLRVEAAGRSSRRFQVEQLGEWLTIRQREFGVTDEDVRDVYSIAVEVGHVSTQANCLGVLAQLRLFDDAGFDECIVGLEDLSSRNFQPYHSHAHALALRAWAIGDEAVARRAHDVADSALFRSAAWCPTEMLLEQLGCPLDPIESQWLEPYELLRDRWLDLMAQAVNRARATRQNKTSY